MCEFSEKIWGNKKNGEVGIVKKHFYYTSHKNMLTFADSENKQFMKLSKIAEILHSNTTNIPETDIQWLLTDSRSLSFPTETLFFALKTKRNNGHRYIAELYRQNLQYFVVSEMPDDFKRMEGAVFLLVEDTLSALQQLAAHHRHHFQIPVVGVTGSNGKTVVKEWLYQLLNPDFQIVRSPKSYNSQIGVPLSVWLLNDNTQLAIFEAGISEPNEMERLQNIIHPTIGIFTNLGMAHQEGFSGLKQKCEEKLKLFKESETLIYCSDDKLLDITIQQAKLKARLFSWGKRPTNQLQIIRIDKTDFSTKIELEYFKKNKFTVEIPFTDDASIENSMQCISAMLCLGINTSSITSRLTILEPVAMRLEVKNGIRNCLIINDTYNSDMNSLNIALNFLNQQSSSKNLSRTLILSDILQSGYNPEKLYDMVAELVHANRINRFVGVGTEMLNYTAKFKTAEKYFFASTGELIKSNLMHELQNEIILLKGSRVFHFEDVLAKLELIAHETTLEVNLNALVNNLNYFRSKLLPQTKVMCMVKAFAYGSGAIEVARTLQHHQADYLAVAVADEGAELRREGIRTPIVVMNPEKGAFTTIFDYKLEPEIYSFRLLKLFMTATEKQGLTNYPIHLKIDTGMHRLGFEEKEITELAELLSNQNQVKVKSVFSHLAGADSENFDDFTKEQAKTFARCANIISKSFPHKILKHILNSAGAERFPEYQFDMVRLGIGHYGISSLPEVKLETVCTLKTILLQTKDITTGETVGYNRNGKITQDSKIGILPIGYADGFDRHLGNGRGEVWIQGQRAKTVGNVSMDLTSVDLTGITANEGDTVEIFGNNITIQEIANTLDTIPYEILTSVSRRVKRIYFID